MKKLLVLALFCLLAFASQAQAQKTYINGIDPNYPPFAYIDEKTGQPAGFDVESMNWIAKKMGFKVEHKPMAWDGIIPSLLAKQIDMIASGIVDPAKVTRLALQNAASVAGLLLTTECMITDIPEEKKAPAAPAGGMDGMM